MTGKTKGNAEAGAELGGRVTWVAGAFVCACMPLQSLHLTEAARPQGNGTALGNINICFLFLFFLQYWG